MQFVYRVWGVVSESHYSNLSPRLTTTRRPVRPTVFGSMPPPDNIKSRTFDDGSVFPIGEGRVGVGKFRGKSVGGGTRVCVKSRVNSRSVPILRLRDL